MLETEQTIYVTAVDKTGAQLKTEASPSLSKAEVLGYMMMADHQLAWFNPDDFLAATVKPTIFLSIVRGKLRVLISPDLTKALSLGYLRMGIAGMCSNAPPESGIEETTEGNLKEHGILLKPPAE